MVVVSLDAGRETGQGAVAVRTPQHSHFSAPHQLRPSLQGLLGSTRRTFTATFTAHNRQHCSVSEIIFGYQRWPYLSSVMALTVKNMSK